MGASKQKEPELNLEDLTISDDQTSPDVPHDEHFTDIAPRKIAQLPQFLINPLKSKKHWYAKWRLWVVIGLLCVAGLVAAWFVQPSRLWIVNTLGLRAHLHITAVTGKVQQPLAGVKLRVDGAEYTTDQQGKADIDVPYGEVNIVASKGGYADMAQKDTFDFNPFFYAYGLGNKRGEDAAKTITFRMGDVGVPISFIVHDWLTGAPITSGEFTAGSATGKPTPQGVVNMTAAPTDQGKVAVHATFGGVYNDRDIMVMTESVAPQIFTFTPGGKDYFVSKRSGVYSVYSSDADGANAQEIVHGTGLETAATNLAVSPSGKYAVLSASRENQKDSGGVLLQKLYIINTADKSMRSVDQARAFTFADWSGDTLVYAAAEHIGSTDSQRLSTLNVASGKQANLLSAAQSFGAIRLSLNAVVFAVTTGGANAELHTIPIGGGTDKMLAATLGALAQTEATTFVYQNNNAWQSYDTNSQQVANAPAPASVTRAFINSASPDNQNQLIYDKIDSKTQLLVKNKATGKETILYTGTIGGPFRWLSNGVVLFRMIDTVQSADYVINIHGGQAKKVTDVSLASGPGVNYLPFY